MKKILLTTDFSDNARNAIHYALSLFEKEASTFYILHAYQMGPSGVGSRADSEQKLEMLMAQLEAIKKNPEHTFETTFIMDGLLSAVGRTIIDKDIDYVFMGTKGSSQIKEIFMGSSTVSIIKNVNSCPIIAVPMTYKIRPLKEIVLVTDFKHFYEKAELMPLLEIVKLSKSMLLVAHINEENELTANQKNGRKLLKNKLEGISHWFHDVEMFSSVSYVAYTLVKENTNIGMIAMLKRRHGFFAKLVREPVIKKIAFKTEVPFLVLPELE
ncbi:MAG: universal stress protein [Saonia sp.]